VKTDRFAIVISGVSLMLLYALTCPAFAQNRTEITAGNVYPGELDMKGFSLKKESRIKLTGSVGLFYERGSELVFYGWILDTKSRKVAWHMLEVKGGYEKGVNPISDEISLPKGDYEIYYTAGLNPSTRIGSRNIVSRILSQIFDVKRRKYYRQYRGRFKLTVSGNSQDVVKADPIELVDLQRENAILSIIRAEDDSRAWKAFSLSKETKIRIYSIGEGNENSIFDYAWIDDIENNKRVWMMSGKKSKGAGGGKKNILIEDEIILPAGKYLVHYITDDSHSYEEWNQLPPDDPQFWGITIWASSERDSQNARLLKNVELPKPVLELTKVRDDERVSRAIKLNKPMDLRVLCVGEGNNRKRSMYDYGWIIHADTREKVWEIKGRETSHAGGAEKNRMIDEMIHLDKGNYIVTFITDDSHSYRDWNAAPPFDPERWGITLWVINEKDRESIESVDPDKLISENVIAKITGVRDDRSLNRPFTLPGDTRLRIIAIGEGTSSGMVDYGWIKERNTGNIVWEMTYKNTQHAGGASKNRLFNGTVLLEKGEYEVHYVTDDSHSYMDWNASPPDDQESYGITLIREGIGKNVKK
jgi:hypothetical protein